jgi:hypothetical protein
MEGKIPQQKQKQNLPPPPPPQVVFNKVASRYTPLNITHNIHEFIDNYLKILLRFNGEGETTTSEHLESFDYFIDNQGLEYEYLYIRILVQTFEGEVRTWFKGFPPNSINSWDNLETVFLRQWGENKYHLYLLTKFENLKKKQNESVSYFIKRFCNIPNIQLGYAT